MAKRHFGAKNNLLLLLLALSLYFLFVSLPSDSLFKCIALIQLYTVENTHTHTHTFAKENIYFGIWLRERKRASA